MGGEYEKGTYRGAVLYRTGVWRQLLLTTYVGQRTRVNGESMYPTPHDDDNLIVDKVSYRFSDPRRYDIIVFPYRYKDMYFIKRIIGLPGETVQILDGYVYIDGKKLDEHFCDEKIQNASTCIRPDHTWRR